MPKIITTPDPRLRQKSTKVREITPEIKQIIQDMIQASLDWEKEHPYEISAAMAAPQLGINQCIIIVRDDFGDKDNQSFTALLNPEVIRTEGKLIKEHEGCLSVPHIYGLVERPQRVKIKAQLTTGQEVRLKASDFLARTLLHEIDHLNGRLFIDLIRDQRDAFFRMDDQGELQPVDYDTVANDKELFPDE